jgi:hypothetical protein
VRLDFAAVWVMQLAFILLGGIHKKSRRRDSVVWLAGGLSAVGMGVLYLLLTGGLSEAFVQLVAIWFSNPPNSPHLGLGSIFTLLSSCLLFLYITFTVIILQRFRFALLSAFLAIVANIIVLRLALPLMTDFEVFGKKVGPYLATSVDGLFLNYSSIFFLMILALIFWEFRTRNLGVNFESGFLLLTSLGLTAQLHNINSAYIYMLNPVFLCCILIYFHQEKPQVLNSNITKPVITTMSILIFISSVNGLFLTSKTIYSYQTPLLNGLASNDKAVRDGIDEKFTLLRDSVSGRNLFMDCPYGLYSVSDAGLIAADKWTWNEIPEKWRLASLEKAKSGQYVLFCGGDETRAVQYAKWEDLGIIVRVGGLQDFNLYQILKKTPSAFS